jgi:hypothetical protein
MNRLHMSVMILGFAVMVGMLVYPPWIGPGTEDQPEPMGYGLLWSPPTRNVEVPALESRWININLSETRKASSIDFGRLVLQEAIAFAVLFGFNRMLGHRTKQV